MDTVRIGDNVPLDRTISFTYEHIMTGTNEIVSPVEFIKPSDPAAEYVSSASRAANRPAPAAIADAALARGTVVLAASAILPQWYVLIESRIRKRSRRATAPEVY